MHNCCPIPYCFVPDPLPSSTSCKTNHKPQRTCSTPRVLRSCCPIPYYLIPPLPSSSSCKTNPKSQSTCTPSAAPYHCHCWWWHCLLELCALKNNTMHFHLIIKFYFHIHNYDRYISLFKCGMWCHLCRKNHVNG